jgi:hypothetical protein
MTLESHAPFNGESKTSRAGGGFEASKDTRKRRHHERRSGRSRTHERAHAPIEPLTIWVRSDPNRLQHPERVEKQKEPEHEKKSTKPELKAEKRDSEPEHKSLKPLKVETTLAPVPEKPPKPDKYAIDFRTDGAIPSPEKPKLVESRRPVIESKSETEMPVLQELPRLDIRPRHFYTEPDIRQPHQAEIEHDILPSSQERTESSPKSSVEERPVQKTPAPELAAVAPLTYEQPAAAPAPVLTEQQPHTGLQLQELAEQKAKRAAELEQKHAEEPALPELKTEQPKTAVNEHVRAVSHNEAETNINMDIGELMEIGDSIRVEGVSITEMFRNDRIDEEGLRRIVVEFLRGARIEKIIADEVLREQMRFERDPQMRQVPLSVLPDPTVTRSSTVVSAQQRKVFNTQTMRRQADRIADRLADGIDRTVEAAENNPNIAKTVGGILAVIVYFVILILIIRS